MLVELQVGVPCFYIRGARREEEREIEMKCPLVIIEECIYIIVLCLFMFHVIV